MFRKRIIGVAVVASLVGVVGFGFNQSPSIALATTTIELIGPPGSEQFGESAIVLGNGNYVVVDTKFDLGGTVDVGAVYLYSGATNQPISSITGSTGGDRIGSGGVVAVGTSNFVIQSPLWNNAGAAGAGALTWVSGSLGLSGQVSPANSLVGATAGDGVGEAAVAVLPSGNFVARARLWDNGPVANVGAVTWVNGSVGATGALNSLNSLVGVSADDYVGWNEIVVLPNGNYLLRSVNWHAGGQTFVGAVTWGNGATGTTGQVSATNSMVGSSTGDAVGGDLVVLKNSNYVIISSFWSSGGVSAAGAVTWANGTGPTAGQVSAANSLIGATADDRLGSSGVVALTNGNFVVLSPQWDNGAVMNAGAATLGNGASGLVGAVLGANSLVGSHMNDFVGGNQFDTVQGAVALANGNYVVISRHWDAGAVTDVGAVSWGNGTTGTTGNVSAANSLVGSTTNDLVGVSGSAFKNSVVALSNGNYVVISGVWDNGGLVNAGAVTWGSGTAGVSGPVTSVNSVIGTVAGPSFGSAFAATALPDGDYVVQNEGWQNSEGEAVGAVLWSDGLVGTRGLMTTANSLYGSTYDDHVGARILPFRNGNFLVISTSWDNGGAVDAGAVTWVNGTTGLVGPVSAANSLVGTSSFDYAGMGGMKELTNGNFVVSSWSWGDGVVRNVGAVTWGNGTTGVAGAISSANSLVGSKMFDEVGYNGSTIALTNGDYVVPSPRWNITNFSASGALTWGSGTSGVVGSVSIANSLIGTTVGDGVGNAAIALPGGEYLGFSQTWDNGQVVDAGAVTFGPAGGVVGAVTAANSAIGTPPGRIAYPAVGFTSGGAIVIGTFQNRVLLLVTSSPQPTTTTTSATTTTVAATTTTTAATTSTVAATTTTTAATTSTVVAPTTTTPAATSTTTAATSTTNPTPPPQVPDFLPFVPARLADTRPGQPTTDGLFAAQGVRSAGSVLELRVAGRGGVAQDAAAVALNVTAVGPPVGGFVTVFPCGATQPTASNLNFDAFAVIPNAVVSKIGANGNVCIFVSEETHLIVDVNGSFPTASSLVSLNPARLLDTRGQPTFDGLQQGGGLVSTGSVTEVQVTDRAGVPTDAAAVVLNVTVTGPERAGFATVFPCGQTLPATSTLNFAEGATIANLAISKVGAGGKICVFAESPTHIVVDVAAYFSAATTYRALRPQRILDTRVGFATDDGISQGAGLQPDGTVTELLVVGRGGVAADAGTVVLNVTVTGTSDQGFITVFPCGITPPLASNLNFTAQATVPNAVIVKVGAAGKVCLLNSGATHLIADINGYFPS